MEIALQREIVTSRRARRVIGMAAFALLTALGAYVRIPLPFSPVPLTLQTFFVLLSGACLGSGLGVASQLGYLFAGVAGLTVFSGGMSGLSCLTGPTGGYLAGFLLAAYLSGKLSRHASKNLSALVAVFLLADGILLATGTIWLKILLGCSIFKAFLVGFLPFIPGDILKAFFAAQLYLKIGGRAKEIF